MHLADLSSKHSTTATGILVLAAECDCPQEATSAMTLSNAHIMRFHSCSHVCKLQSHISQLKSGHLKCRYMSGLASASGLSLSSVVVTSQQAGSIVLGTALDFPSNTTSYAALATTIYFQTSPNAVFASDSTFASQYGPVVFSNFNSVGLNFTTALLPQSGFAQIEGNVDTPSAAPELLTLGASLSPIEAGDMARIESSSYGTYIPVNGYEPPPPPPTSPPPPPPSPPPPGTTTASTGTATATATPTPTPTATSSAVGAC